MINHNEDKMMQYIDYRLKEWANWFGRGNFYGIGYPPYSTEYKLMMGIISEKQHGVRVMPCNEDAEEMEKLIYEMSKQNNKMAIALRIHYLDRDKLQMQKREIGIGETKFRVYIQMARQWLAGRLSAYRL